MCPVEATTPFSLCVSRLFKDFAKLLILGEMSGRRPGQYSEIEELNRILTVSCFHFSVSTLAHFQVERELVLKTQENYRTLKEKYLELSRENDLLKKEQEKLLEGAESRGKLQELEARSDELIRNMRQANEEREVRYEKFKVETIEELQNVYRKVRSLLPLCSHNLQFRSCKTNTAKSKNCVWTEWTSSKKTTNCSTKLRV